MAGKLAANELIDGNSTKPEFKGNGKLLLNSLVKNGTPESFRAYHYSKIVEKILATEEFNQGIPLFQVMKMLRNELLQIHDIIVYIHKYEKEADKNHLETNQVVNVLVMMMRVNPTMISQ